MDIVPFKKNKEKWRYKIKKNLEKNGNVIIEVALREQWLNSCVGFILEK